MAIPLVYNVRSVRARWTSTIVAVMGIAGTVGVFVAMLSLARGFRATLVSSGSADNALITRAGATSEMTSGVSLDSVKIIEGRMFRPGLSEIVVGKNAKTTYSGLTLGSTIWLGSARWEVVGIFDAGGSAFDSEVWGDAHLLNGAYKRPDTFSQSVTVHLASPAALQ